MTGNNTVKTTAQLRTEIDRGEGSDKVDFPDPAAAPLGTDAEAGGASPAQSEVEIASEAEINRRSSKKVSVDNRYPEGWQEKTHSFGRKLVIVAVVVAIALTGLLLFLAAT